MIIVSPEAREMAKDFPDEVSLTDSDGKEFEDGPCIIPLEEEHKWLLAQMCIDENKTFDEAFVSMLRGGIDIMEAKMEAKKNDTDNIRLHDAGQAEQVDGSNDGEDTSGDRTPQITN